MMTVQKKPRIIAVLVGVFAALMLALSFMAPSLADGDPNKDANSFYNLSSGVSGAYSNVGSPNGDAMDPEKWAPALKNPANAGSVVGFSDPNITEGVLKWITSNASGSSGAISYRTFAETDKTIEGSKVLEYAHYGATLKDLGLDTTSNQMAPGIKRFVLGFIMMGAFVASSVVSMAFRLSLEVLIALNPFKFLFDGVNAVSTEFANGMTKGQGNGANDGALSGVVSSAFSGIRALMSGLYKVLYEIGWMVVVPLFLATVAISVITLRTSSVWGPIRKFATRGLFLVVGIPLLGSLYTATLDTLANDSVYTAGNGASQVIMSNYVDFEKWAFTSRLAVPTSGGGVECDANITWDDKAMGASGASHTTVKDIALCINALSGYDGLEKSLTGSASTPGAGFTVTNPDVGGNDQHNLIDTAKTLNLLVRYTFGDTVSAADFESVVKANTPKDAVKEEWFSKYRKVGDASKQDPKENPYLVVPDGTGLQADTKDHFTKYSSKGIEYGHGDQKACGPRAMTKDGKPVACNLSPLAMFNYLNTSFESSSLITYSSEKVGSLATREQHNAVNQVGAAGTGLMYYINALSLLLSFAVLGFVYALGMLIGAIKRMVNFFTTIPFAMLGALPAIAKVITIVLAMITEIIGTMFLYALVQYILMALPALVERPFTAFVSDKSVQGSMAKAIVGAGVLVNPMLGQFLVIATYGLSTVIILWFTFVAIRFRKTFMKVVDEVSHKAISRLVGTEVNPDVKAPKAGMFGKGLAAAGGVAGAAAGGVGGMMLANKLGAAGGAGDPRAVLGQRDKLKGASGSTSASGGSGAEAAGGFGMGGNVLDATEAKRITAGVEGQGGLSDPNNPNPSGDLGDSVGTSLYDNIERDRALDKAADRARLEAAKDAAVGGGVGAAKVAGGAVTGNAAMAVDGAQDIQGGMQKGVEGIQGANEIAAEKDKSASEAREEGSYSGGIQGAGTEPTVLEGTSQAVPQSAGGADGAPQVAFGGSSSSGASEATEMTGETGLQQASAAHSGAKKGLEGSRLPADLVKGAGVSKASDAMAGAAAGTAGAVGAVGAAGALASKAGEKSGQKPQLKGEKFKPGSTQKQTAQPQAGTPQAEQKGAKTAPRLSGFKQGASLAAKSSAVRDGLTATGSQRGNEVGRSMGKRAAERKPNKIEGAMRKNLGLNTQQSVQQRPQGSKGSQVSSGARASLKPSHASSKHSQVSLKPQPQKPSKLQSQRSNAFVVMPKQPRSLNVAPKPRNGAPAKMNTRSQSVPNVVTPKPPSNVVMPKPRRAKPSTVTQRNLSADRGLPTKAESGEKIKRVKPSRFEE